MKFGLWTAFNETSRGIPSSLIGVCDGGGGKQNGRGTKKERREALGGHCRVEQGTCISHTTLSAEMYVQGRIHR